MRINVMCEVRQVPATAVTGSLESLMERLRREPPHTDAGNAERFYTAHKGRVLRVRAERQWYRYDGRRWDAVSPEEISYRMGQALAPLHQDAAALDRALREAIRKEAGASGVDAYERFGKVPEQYIQEKRALDTVQAAALRGESRRARENAIAIAVSLTGVQAQAEAFDSHKLLLNLQNGTLDLTTHTLRPHRPEDRLTLLAGVSYQAGATAPLWYGFLKKFTNGDTELEAYLQEWAGYTLTGNTHEQFALFFRGGGSNGKSTFLSTLGTLLGDYFIKVDADFLTEGGDKKGERQKTVIAARKARLLIGPEIERGQRLALAFFKDITGGSDVVRGRALYQKEVVLVPECKVAVAANHDLELRSLDYGTRRRIRTVPVEHNFDHDRDKDTTFADKLKAELPGILNWALAGLKRYQERGKFATSTAVERRTGAYFDAQDTVAAFVDERCELCPNDKAAKEDVGTLYEAYVAWCKANRRLAVTKQEFGNDLSKQGLERFKSNGKTYRIGVRLLKRDSSF